MNGETRAVSTRVPNSAGSPTDALPSVDETAQRLAERVERVRRAREYRQQVREYLEAHRAAGKAMRHARRLADSEPVGHLDPNEVAE